MLFKVSPVQGCGGRQTLAYESAGELKDPSPSHLSTHTTSLHSHRVQSNFSPWRRPLKPLPRLLQLISLHTFRLRKYTKGTTTLASSRSTESLFCLKHL